MSSCSCNVLATSLFSQVILTLTESNVTGFRWFPNRSISWWRNSCRTTLSACSSVNFSVSQGLDQHFLRFGKLLYLCDKVLLESLCRPNQCIAKNDKNIKKLQICGSNTVVYLLGTSCGCRWFVTAGVLPTASFLNWFGCHMVTTWLCQEIKQHLLLLNVVLFFSEEGGGNYNDRLSFMW